MSVSCGETNLLLQARCSPRQRLATPLPCKEVNESSKTSGMSLGRAGGGGGIPHSEASLGPEGWVTGALPTLPLAWGPVETAIKPEAQESNRHSTVNSQQPEGALCGGDGGLVHSEGRNGSQAVARASVPLGSDPH